MVIIILFIFILSMLIIVREYDLNHSYKTLLSNDILVRRMDSDGSPVGKSGPNGIIADADKKCST